MQHFVVNETTALRDGAKLLDTRAASTTWKKYLAFHLASDYATDLPKAFDDASFDFFSKTLRGVEEQRDRWKRGVTLLDAQIGEGVGELYVAQVLPARDTRRRWTRSSPTCARRWASGSKTLAWMDDATRAEALKKLATFDPRIGYPVEVARLLGARRSSRASTSRTCATRATFEWKRQVATARPAGRSRANGA